MDLKLSAQKREKNEKMAADFLAAIVYGKGLENRSIKINRIEFEKIFLQAGETNLINLDIDGKVAKVLVKDMQKDPVKDFVTHVDFYEVNMKEKVTADVPLKFVGESKAVKELGGILIKEVHEIKVECLPGDLVDHLVVDITILETLDGIIKIGDIKLPKGMELLLDPETTIALIAEPKVQEEVAPEVTEEAKTDEAEKKEEKKTE
ncbi:MAG: 50S ribosomal protein L25 [Patescibacteria group bacterium]|nr:50S ribosomal protein L25 [Patescibacteria group bacterium]MDD3777954.1 50S ribosomal protein L25 [Patescibacteria group bacterium]MDD3939107.1 50S ribosomal protein L25 [Patescibacteria group bacterium]MDD4443590.1 50S ribosomal protein L25 [Patescibacteria group bacterium]NCU39340.1 50S ribosomal protein L25 [Candidatus Falkowbacteria bacterium]